MKKIQCLLAALFLSACAGVPYKPGSVITGPLIASIDSASAGSQKVYATGAKPKDATVKKVITDLASAKKQVVVVTKVIDTQNKTIATDAVVKAKQAHRILVDDIVYGVCVLGMLAITLGPILIKSLPLLAL
jgi:hypothetical protein